MEDKKRPGRPRGTSPYGMAPGSEGGPQLNLRLSPDLYAWVKARPEGATAFVRGLIEEAMRAETGRAADEAEEAIEEASEAG